jgi:hypothetical protein
MRKMRSRDVKSLMLGAMAGEQWNCHGNEELPALCCGQIRAVSTDKSPLLRMEAEEPLSDAL